MKSSRFSALCLLSLCLYLSYPSCSKQDDPLPPDNNPTPTDTIPEPDTPAVKDKIVRIQVKELGTGLPVANCQVFLYGGASSPFYPTFYYRTDSLGLTDNQGQLLWHWQGDTLPPNTYLGFEGVTYSELSDKLLVGKVPADQYEGQLYAPGVVQLRIKINRDSLNFDAVEVVQYHNGYYTQTPNWYSRASFSQKAPFDTTITLVNAGPAKWAHGIRFNLDNSSYNSYLYSAETKQVDVTFQARDTLYQEVVIE